MCLKRSDNKHYVFYKEDASSLRMDLSEMGGPQKAIAVDARRRYAEMHLGELHAENQIWRPPYKPDWAITVGHFLLQEVAR